MCSKLKCIFILFICVLHIGCVLSAEILLKDDKPYDIINIEIPAKLWQQALKPTPVAKTGKAATIVVPVQVNQDYTDEELEDEEEVVVEDNVVEIQNISVEGGEVQDTVEETATQAEVLEEVVSEAVSEAVSEEAITNETAVLSTTTERPLLGQGLRFPCSCVDGQCGCCTAMNLQWFKSHACGNITFVPEDFVFDVKLSFNNSTVVHRRVSASDPPPICFNPRRAPFIDICIEITNIRIRNQNAFACLDISANIADFPIYTASFRCFGLGSKGVQSGLKPKPVSQGPAPVSLFGNNNEDDDGGGLFGSVAEGVLGGGLGEGLFGGSDDGDDDSGPFDGIGDAIGGLFEGRATRF